MNYLGVESKRKPEKMILDAYVNTLFPQEKQKIKLYLSHFLSNSCFFSPNLIYRNMNC